MRLLELNANQSSFKPVRFNRSGLSLIVGRYTNRTRRDVTSTYNGVGKSLVVALIHYCLGSNGNSHFDEHLNGWRFTLIFEHEGAIHEITRAPTESKLLLDGTEYSLRNLNAHLAEMGLFHFPAECPKFLTWRSALTFFLRPKKSSYTSFDQPEENWTPYQSLLIQSFLLGLEIERVVEKHDAKKRLDELDATAKRFKDDKDLRSFFVGDRNAQVEAVELASKISDLGQNIERFQVAEDYADRRVAADRLHQDLMDFANEQVLQRNLIEDIDLALQVRADATPEDVIRLYKEARIALPDLVTKRLSDVEEFHQRLQQNRRNRLLVERRNAEARLIQLQSRREETQRKLDAELQYLGAHRALDEYTENHRYLAELTARQRKIQDYLKLLEFHDEQARNIKKDMAEASINAAQYLKNTKPYLGGLMDRFRSFAHELYGPVASGLVVSNNDGDNQLRYGIEAHIPFDAADGINHGKIFCYDLLLLTLQQRHSMEFLFHDNRLFAEMDHRQRFGLFRLADRICRENDLQYIASINNDLVESTRDIAGADFERLFVAPRVLELTDEAGGAGKLLGTQIDMNYEARKKASKKARKTS